jgi:peptidoglycan hydrolase CwlO-like protein
MRRKFVVMLLLLAVSGTISAAQENTPDNSATQTVISETQAKIDELSKQNVPEKVLYFFMR